MKLDILGLYIFSMFIMWCKNSYLMSMFCLFKSLMIGNRTNSTTVTEINSGNMCNFHNRAILLPFSHWIINGDFPHKFSQIAFHPLNANVNFKNKIVEKNDSKINRQINSSSYTQKRCQKRCDIRNNSNNSQKCPDR